MGLEKKRCVPCEGGVKPFSYNEALLYLKEVPSWKLEKGKENKISREYKFKDFGAALKFVNKVGAIAEGEGHHPNIYIHNWNRVTLTNYTHFIHGLSENDFILAAKIDRIK